MPGKGLGIPGGSDPAAIALNDPGFRSRCPMGRRRPRGLRCDRLWDGGRLQHEETKRLEEAQGARADAHGPVMSDDESDRLRREREIIAEMELDFHSH